MNAEKAPDREIELSWRRVLPFYALALGGATVVSWGWAALAFEPPYLGSLGLGWGVAAAGAAAGLSGKWIGIGRDPGWFLAWAIGVSGLRFLLLLLIVVAVHRSGVAPFRPFIIGLFTSFFALQFCEILTLHSSTRGRDGI